MANKTAIHKAVACELCGAITALHYYWSLDKWICESCSGQMAAILLGLNRQ